MALQDHNTVVGVDGCPAGWISFQVDLQSRATSVRVFPTFSELISTTPRPKLIAIDIPIGLPTSGPRACDIAARRLLGKPRSNSVFPAPIRATFNAKTYAEACAISLQAQGKSLSRQAFEIIPKIREVDGLVTPELQQWVFEVHPEVSFWTLNGRQPLKHRKLDKEGREERLTLLLQHYPAMRRHLAELRRVEVAEHDLLDAAVAAWTAECVVTGIVPRGNSIAEGCGWKSFTRPSKLLPGCIIQPINFPVDLEASQVKSRKVGGLVLDDLLFALDRTKTEFDLSSVRFAWNEIKEYGKARDTLVNLIASIVSYCGSCIYSCRHSLISDLGPGIYCEQIVTPAYSGFRIAAKQVRSVLEKVLELALQTIIQLPTRPPKVGLSSRTLRQLARHFEKVVAEAEETLNEPEARQRVCIYLSHSRTTGLSRLRRIIDDLNWAVNVLNGSVSSVAVSRSKWDSPNPQVSFALYLVGWIEAASGRPHYDELSTLLAASFHAANPNKPIPKWVDRLAVEMRYKRIHRMKLAKTVLSVPAS